MTLQPGGPGGKYLGRSGPFLAAELRELLADVRDQLEREPGVLDHLEEAILAGDLTTTTEVMIHLRDFFALLMVLVGAVHVAQQSGPAGEAGA
jgi:hypothetical protein